MTITSRSLAISTQPYEVATRPVGDGTSRTAWMMPVTTRATTEEKASREKRGITAARSPAAVPGRRTARNTPVSPPSHTAIAATCTVVTVTASPGHGPATGWPIAAAATTSPTANMAGAASWGSSGGAGWPQGRRRGALGRRALPPGRPQRRRQPRGQDGSRQDGPAGLRTQRRRQQGGIEQRPQPGTRGVRALHQEAQQRAHDDGDGPPGGQPAQQTRPPAAGPAEHQQHRHTDGQGQAG